MEQDRRVFPTDYDADGICDSLDPDDDNDAWNDTDLGDGKIDAFPFNKDEWNDTDGDGIGDNSDDDADGDGWTNEQENQTGDTTSWLDNGSSLDSDGDGWLDGTELLCGSNPNGPNQTPNDLDNDGVCDLMDDDADGDGWTNEQEGWLTDETSWLDSDVDTTPMKTRHVDERPRKPHPIQCFSMNMLGLMIISIHLR